MYILFYLFLRLFEFVIPIFTSSLRSTCCHYWALVHALVLIRKRGFLLLAMAFKFAKNPKKMKKSKVPMTKHFYSFFNELTPKEEEFFDLVEKCDLPAIEKFLITNRVNINMKNYQGITPLHLAIQNDCEPLVEMFLQHSGKRTWRKQPLFCFFFFFQIITFPKKITKCTVLF